MGRRTQGGASLCPGLSHFAPLGRGNKKPPPRGDFPRFLVPGFLPRCDLFSFLANSGLPDPLFSYTLVISSR